MRRYQIAVIGAAEAKEWEKELAFSVGRLIAAEGCILLTGGRGGVMEAASQGASEAGGFVAGIVPGSEGNQYLDLIIKTQMGQARNVILVESADAVIAVSGSYGTLSEIGVSLRIGTPVFGIKTWDIPGLIPCQTPEEAVYSALEFCNSMRISI
ncbi:TIGR00725 family protein [Methanospirillum lacunae]|uniref:TIGR00725 family protein n=1 Tax=Methanospirillum lacunae TaxID=668570 RepID=A0A2V2NBU5_9EURY|nr:TIGR00725 family protein [Methanospirillum lacunae]PWR73817.1 TIGR00725 family protein [Methanospirillum lacunae]